MPRGGLPDKAPWKAGPGGAEARRGAVRVRPAVGVLLEAGPEGAVGQGAGVAVGGVAAAVAVGGGAGLPRQAHAAAVGIGPRGVAPGPAGGGGQHGGAGRRRPVGPRLQRPVMARLAGGAGVAAVLVPAVAGRVGGTAPVGHAGHVVGGGDHVLAGRAVVGGGAEAGQQAGARVVEHAGYLFVRGSVEIRPQGQMGGGSDDGVARQPERVVQGAGGEGFGHAVGVDAEGGEAGGAAQGAEVERQAGVAGDGRHARAVEGGADQAAGVAGGAGQAEGGVGQMDVAGAALAEGVDRRLQQVGHVQLAPRVHGAVVERLRLRQGDLQFAGQGQGEGGVIGPAGQAVGFGAGGVLRDGQAEVGEEGEVDGVRPEGRQGDVLAAVGHERDADAAVGEVEGRGLRVGGVQERRRAAMHGHDVRAVPGAGGGVGVGVVAVAVAHPGAQDVPDFVGQGGEQGGVTGVAEMGAVDFNGAETRLPGIAGGRHAALRPAHGAAGHVAVHDVDLDPGAGLAARPDADFRTVVQPALEVGGGAFPDRPGIGNALAPDLAGAFEHGAEAGVVAHFRGRPRQVEGDGQGVAGAARPAAIGHAAAGAEDGDVVRVAEVRGRRLAAFLRRALQRPEIGGAGAGRGVRQGEAVRNAGGLPVPPMVQQVGGFGVVARALGQAAAAGHRQGVGRCLASRQDGCRGRQGYVLHRQGAAAASGQQRQETDEREAGQGAFVGVQPDLLRGRGGVGGLRLLHEDVDLAFVAGDALADADGEFAEGGDFGADVLDAPVLVVEVLVHPGFEAVDALVLGVEALVDGPVLVLEALVHPGFEAVDALVLGVEALVDGPVLVLEALVDGLVLGVETPVHLGFEAVDTLVLGVEALVDGPVLVIEALVHPGFEAVEALVLDVEALVDGLVLVIEALVDGLVLGVETPVHLGFEAVEALVLDVEALVDGPVLVIEALVHLGFEAVEALVLGVEALVDGPVLVLEALVLAVEALVDGPVLVIEALVDVDAQIIEAVMDGVEEENVPGGDEQDADTRQCGDGKAVVSKPGP